VVSAPRTIIRPDTVDSPYQVGSQADSAGSIPVTRSTREKRCSTSESDCIFQAGQRSFASENGTRAITRALSHLGECPWRLSVPKLTVRVRFPSPAPYAKTVVAEPNWWISILSGSVFRAMLGPLWATDIHTWTLTLRFQKDAQLVPSCSPAIRSPVLPTHPSRVSATNYELDVNGLNCDAAKELDP
jgi:hypothetical protein